MAHTYLAGGVVPGALEGDTRQSAAGSAFRIDVRVSHLFFVIALRWEASNIGVAFCFAAG